MLRVAERSQGRRCPKVVISRQPIIARTVLPATPAATGRRIITAARTHTVARVAQPYVVSPRDNIRNDIMATLLPDPGEHYFEADGIRFHYLVRGAGPLMVVQSVGWGLSGGYLWNGMGPHLEEKYTVLYLEPRGNGKSSKPEDPLTMTAKTMAEDLEHLRKHLGLEFIPTLLGGSHAGAIALRYAERYPSRVEKLVLVSPQLMDELPNTNFQDWFGKRKDDPAYAAAIAAFGKLRESGLPSTDEDFRAFTDAAMTWWFSDPTKADILRQHIAAGPTLPGFYAFQTNSLDRKPENVLPHIAEAGRVEAKTLIIWGEQDAITSVGGGNQLAEGIRDSKLVVIPDVGHFPYIENPDAFWPELDAFLSS